MAARNADRRLARWPVFAAAAVSLLSIAATTTYALLGFAGRVPVTVGHFFAGNALYVLVNGTLLYLLWRRRHLFGFATKAFAIAWAGIFAWWSLPQPIFLVLTIHPDPLQTQWMFFTWMWEIPIIGGFLFGGFVLRLLRPITAAVAGHPAGRASSLPDAAVYSYVLRFPFLVAASLVVFATLGYFLGALQSRVFGFLPLIESAKVFGQGFVSSLFMAIFYYFAYTWYLRGARHRLEERRTPAEMLPLRSHFAWRVFVVTSIISLGSLLYTSFVVLQSFQTQLSANLSSQLTYAMAHAQAELGRVRRAEATVYETVLNAHLESMRQGQRGRVLPLAAAEAAVAELSEQTQLFVSEQDFGVKLDSRGEHKLIGVWREPRGDQKLLAVTYLGDFAGSLRRGMLYFAAVGSFVSFLSILTTTAASVWLASALRGLSRAVRQAEGKPQPFTYDTHTADELEDLAHAFAYYINRAKDKTAELAEAVEHLQELDRLKTDFVSIASHQMRTPLTGIRWAYHALLDEELGKLTPGQRETAEGGLLKTTGLIALVNDLLNVSRIEQQALQFAAEDMSLAQVARLAYDNVRGEARNRGVRLHLRLPVVPLPPFRADREKIAMVISNLLDNAVKYTPRGGAVTLSLAPVKGGLRLTVEDTGIGIPAAKIPYLFSRFFRAPNAIRMYPNGSGLGLYIVKSIVEKYGGSVSVYSREGQGSTFIVFLPRG